ncbi:MAG: Polymer-forming cytoskeletal [Desulfomicrobiaceae bacterium]|nr:Polymer-forming cytoskeletal [Desulfomicrobiaceae bacterium]MDK2873585.1 Polymer-forming cytoskeletal [Desulfomicrobiaceae bacterium]
MPQRGFTLVEAAIVLVLLGILAALVVPALVSSTRHEKRQEGKEALLALRHAIVEWAGAHNDTLPANLTSAQLPDTDIWGRAYAYRPFSSTISVCTTPNATATQIIRGSDSVNAAFWVASRGHDTTQDLDYTAPVLNTTDPKDDLVEWMGMEELYYLICTGTNTSPQAHNATQHLLFSPAAIAMPQNSDVTGNVASDGSIAIQQNVDINGTIFAGGAVDLAQNTQASGIIANGSISLAQHVIIHGDIHAGGDITIAQNTDVYGNVYAAGSVHIRGTVHGNVVAGGTVTVTAPGSVTGTIQQNQSPVPGLQPYVSPGIPRMQTFASTGPDVSSGGPLAPGNYGSVTIPKNGMLTLQSGSYVFKNLSMNKGILRLNFNATGTLADIQVFVVEKASLSKITTQISLDGTTFTDATNASTDAAQRMYLEAHGDFSFTGATSVWTGGVLTNGTAEIDAKAFVGHIAAIPPGNFDLKHTDFVYVPSHFAQTHW